VFHFKVFFMQSFFKRNEISRVDMLTGGMRISRDEEFVEKIASYNPYIYVNLSFDGFTSDPYIYIRGKDYLDTKIKAFHDHYPGRFKTNVYF